MWSLHLMTSEERRAWLEDPMERFKTFEEEDRTSNEPMPPIVLEWEREDRDYEELLGGGDVAIDDAGSSADPERV